jgi:acyl-CoA synthetase (AMP-forming)/AMP-acid ligase II
LSYRDLHRVSDDVADGLASRGIGPGDVVALSVPSSPDYLVSYVAVAKAGATTVGVNPRLPADQRCAVLTVAAPSLVIGTADLMEGVPAGVLAEEVGLAASADEILTTLRRAHRPQARPPADDGRPVAIVFTSGTTGTPKGAVFTGRQLRAIAQIDAGSRRDGGGPMLASTELVHVGVMTKLPWYLRTGATLHLLRRWRAADALRVISRESMTSIGAIAPQVALLLRQPDFDSYDLRAVRTIVAGGAPSPPTLVLEARERFGAAYSIRYSSTESGGVGTATAFNATDAEALHTVGRPRDGVALTIRDQEGAEVPRGAIGEIWLRSAAVMAGYWRDPRATAETLVGGWLRTDDLGSVDHKGLLRLVGRRGDSYIRGGYNVHPQPVEAVLGAHPAVREVAVIPTTDAVLGQVGVAVIVAAEGMAPPTLEDLRAHAAAHLAHHELPERLAVVAALPRTPLDKIDRRRLASEMGPDLT